MKKHLSYFCAVIAAIFSGCAVNDAVIAQAQTRIRKNQASCILIKGGKVVTQEVGRGLAPLLTVLDRYPEAMKDGIIVDKVIGKAAAAIIICGQAQEVYTELICEPGLALLQKHGVKVRYKTCVPQILNRTQSDLCPMEKRVAEINDPQKALEALRKK